LAVVARYFPALQSLQNDSDEEPRTVEYLPKPQTEQADEATPAANLPGRQKKQILEFKFSENLPGGQSRQAVGEDAELLTENFPVVHDVHTDTPSALLKLPASHAKYEDEDVAPRVGKYLPVLHAEQDVAPVTSEYFPD
jgi:hypothetical protein